VVDLQEVDGQEYVTAGRWWVVVYLLNSPNFSANSVVECKVTNTSASRVAAALLSD
jgi:hypothetical protein